MHRAQITFDHVDTESGEVRTGPALELALNIARRARAWRVSDVLADSGKPLVQLANLLLQLGAAGALSIAV